MTNPTPRRCPKCAQEKPVEAFTRNRSTSSGRHTYCRKCCADSYRERYAANAELRKLSTERNRIWRLNNPERFKAAQKRWNDKHTERRRAARVAAMTSITKVEG